MIKSFYTRKNKYTIVIEHFPEYAKLVHPSYYFGFHKWKTINNYNICFTFLNRRIILSKTPNML